MFERGEMPALPLASSASRAPVSEGWTRAGHGDTLQSMILRFAIVLLVAGGGWAQDIARMEEVIQSYAANRQFMGSVLVAKGTQVLLSKGYGFANLEWDVPNSPATKFRLGSITKQFTAASILLLQDRGKLNVEDPVKKYMTDAPAAWDKITIYHLLTHTSGIPSFTSFPEYPKWEPFAATPAEEVARFRDKPLDFAPGEKWSYSNSGYVLLGYLIEKITGGSYEKFVRENIFAPLGMKDSGYDSNSAIIPRRASGYELSKGEPVNAGFVNMTIPFSAGALDSTTEDLLKWEQGLFGGKLLTAASLLQMTKPFQSNYACGLFVETKDGRKVIQHGGGIEGFNTQLTYYPEDMLTVIVLGNVSGSAPGDIAAKLAALAHGEAVKLPAERKEITLDPKVLARYVGTYELMAGANMLITLEGNQLSEKLASQSAFPIFPESETMFFLKVVDAQIEFVKDSSGAVTHLVLHQGGRDQKAPRTSDKAEGPPPRKEIQVSPQLLARYAGTYDLGPGADVTMTVEGGRLMTQITGQPKFELFAESETRFFLKVIDAQVEFFVDPSGTVTHLVIHQGGRETKAPRK
jgi:CubicO group peptidase (beta-lactamase class C family)